jgi:hypothetical protein
MHGHSSAITIANILQQQNTGMGSGAQYSIPNLEYYYDASLLTGLTDGQEIISLPDFSGKNKTLNPLSAARRPTYETSEINGLPVIRFANTDNLVGVKTDFDFMHQGSNTIFFLIRPSDNASTRYLFSSSENSQTNIGRTIRYLTNGVYNDAVHNTTSGQTVFTFTTPNGEVANNAWSLIVVRYERNKTLDDAELFTNNFVAQTNQGTLSPSASTSSVNPTFFSLASGGSSFQGDAALWFGYSRALSNDEINRIVGGLGFSTVSLSTQNGVSVKYGLGLRRLVPDFISNGRSVSLGTETTIKTGVGSTEYLSFGDIKIDASGVIHHAYRQGSGHNLGNDGHIMYQKGTWNGSSYTWSTAVQIVTNGSGTYNTTNPALTVTYTGRIICFYTKQDLPSSLLTQQTYLIYSDDGGNTWSSNGYDGSEIKVSNDIAYMNIIGSAIEQDGLLLLPIYSRVSVTSGNEYVMCYSSSNNGE